MKKTQEVIGLPIISISDGMEVGKVSNVIVDASKGAIDYIVVESGIRILGARVIPSECILGIGEYALTIENDSVISDISKIPEAIDLLQKNILVKGTRVLTKKGRLIGEIGDFYVDEDNCCKIIGLEFISDPSEKTVRYIPRDSVITFGKNLIVVVEEVEGNLLNDPSQLDPLAMITADEKKNITSFGNELAYSAADLFETDTSTLVSSESEEAVSQIIQDFQFVHQEQENTEYISGSVKKDEYAENSHSSQEGSSAADLFEQRQRQYLTGRKATKTITGTDGEVIIDEGSVITEEIINIAQSSGKLVELVMNNMA